MQNTHRRIAILIVVGVVVLTLVVLSGGLDDESGPTDGEESGPEPADGGEGIEISTCSDLRQIGENLAGDYVVISDLQCSESREWNDGSGLIPLGGNGPQDAFSGTFDGQGHSITNLYIDNDTANYVGLFGRIGVDDPMDPNYPKSGTIRNVEILNASTTGGDLSNTGIIAGSVPRGIIHNVTVSGTITNEGNAGGVAGTLGANATINETSSGVRVINDGSGKIGGIAGENNGGTIEESMATGFVKGSNHVDAGGLVGWNTNGSRIQNSYSRAAVETSGQDAVSGGIAAFNWERASIRNSYSAGAVSGEAEVGGLVAISQAECPGSFWDIPATGQSTSACGTGQNTEMMQTRAPFIEAGWDFEKIWYMSGYPALRAIGDQ